MASNNSLAFQQQGQVDWVAASRTTVSFSLEILKRISDADIDAYTLVVAQNVMHQFHMPVIGQQRVQDAIKQLRSTSSFGDVIWFGFGVKHLVRSLSQSDDGMACLALFGSLTEVFSPEVSALVAYELSKLLYPDEKLPAVSQWQRMLAVCSGILATSNFPLIAEHFLGLAGNRRAVTSKARLLTMPSRVMGDIGDFARALHAICLITRVVEQRSVTIVGGPSCGFLAAFAYWFLALEVEIRHIDSSEVLYASKLDCEPHIIILYDKAIGQGQGLAAQISERTYMVRQVDGGLFTRVDDRHVLYYGGRVQSDHAIRSAFGDQGCKLLAGPNLPIMLGKAARILQLMDARERSTEYLDAALALFPELSDSIDLARRVAMEDSLVSSVQMYQRTLEGLKRDCSCEECLSRRNTRSRDPHHVPKVIACLGRLAEVLISAVWDLENINVFGETINPSLRGFQHYYWWWEERFRMDSERYTPVTATLFLLKTEEPPKLAKPPLSLETICFAAMTILGGEVGDAYDLFQKLKHTKPLAITSGGNCFYFSILEQVTDDPGLATRLNIIPGCIQASSGHTFLQIEEAYESSLRSELPDYPIQGRRIFDPAVLFEDTGARLSAELVAKETSSSLYVEYRLTSTYGSCKLSPARLIRRLLQSSAVGYCVHRPNGELPTLEGSIEIPMLDGEGTTNAVEDSKDGTKAVVRRLHGNTMARCIALSSVHCPELWVTHRAVLRANGQCFNCCLEKASEVYANHDPREWGRVIVYIIM